MVLFWTIGTTTRWQLGQQGKQLGPQNGRLLELGNNWEHQLRARSGRLFEGEIMVLFWTIGTTTRAAKRPPSWIGQQLGTSITGAKRSPFWRRNNGSFFWQLGQQLGPQNGRLHELGNNWEQQLQPRSGRLFEGKIMGLFWTIGNSYYGREVRTTTVTKRPPSWTLKGHYIWWQATTGKNFGRKGAAALVICWEQLRSRSGRLFIGQTETTTAAKRPPSWIRQLPPLFWSRKYF